MEFGLLKRKTTPKFVVDRAAVLHHLAVHNATQKDVARQTKIAAGYVSTLFSGRHPVSARTRAKLMAAPVLADLGFDDLFRQVPEAGGAP